jgi:hypothetical protein
LGEGSWWERPDRPAPFLEGDAKLVMAEDLVVPGPKPVRVWERRTRREGRKGEAFFLELLAGEPERSEAQESKRFRPGLNLRGAARDTALLVGSSRWSTGGRPSRFFGKVQGRRELLRGGSDHR